MFCNGGGGRPRATLFFFLSIFSGNRWYPKQKKQDKQEALTCPRFSICNIVEQTHPCAPPWEPQPQQRQQQPQQQQQQPPKPPEAAAPSRTFVSVVKGEAPRDPRVAGACRSLPVCGLADVLSGAVPLVVPAQVTQEEQPLLDALHAKRRLWFREGAAASKALAAECTQQFMVAAESLLVCLRSVIVAGVVDSELFLCLAPCCEEFFLGEADRDLHVKRRHAPWVAARVASLLPALPPTQPLQQQQQQPQQHQQLPLQPLHQPVQQWQPQQQPAQQQQQMPQQPLQQPAQQQQLTPWQPRQQQQPAPILQQQPASCLSESALADHDQWHQLQEEARQRELDGLRRRVASADAALADEKMGRALDLSRAASESVRLQKLQEELAAEKKWRAADKQSHLTALDAEKTRAAHASQGNQQQLQQRQHLHEGELATLETALRSTRSQLQEQEQRHEQALAELKKKSAGEVKAAENLLSEERKARAAAASLSRSAQSSLDAALAKERDQVQQQQQLLQQQQQQHQQVTDALQQRLGVAEAASAVYLAADKQHLLELDAARQSLAVAQQQQQTADLQRQSVSRKLDASTERCSELERELQRRGASFRDDLLVLSKQVSELQQALSGETGASELLQAAEKEVARLREDLRDERGSRHTHHLALLASQALLDEAVADLGTARQAVTQLELTLEAERLKAKQSLATAASQQVVGGEELAAERSRAASLEVRIQELANEVATQMADSSLLRLRIVTLEGCALTLALAEQHASELCAESTSLRNQLDELQASVLKYDADWLEMARSTAAAHDTLSRSLRDAELRCTTLESDRKYLRQRVLESEEQLQRLTDLQEDDLDKWRDECSRQTKRAVEAEESLKVVLAQLPRAPVLAICAPPSVVPPEPVLPPSRPQLLLLCDKKRQRSPTPFGSSASLCSSANDALETSRVEVLSSSASSAGTHHERKAARVEPPVAPPAVQSPVGAPSVAPAVDPLDGSVVAEAVPLEADF